MKLREFNKETAGHRVSNGKPTLRTHKSGGFTIAKAAAEIMNLKYGDAVVVLQDEERPKDWYIKKTRKDNGFIVRGKQSVPGGTKEQVLMFSSSATRTAILKSIGIPTSENVTLLVGQLFMDGDDEMFAIITKKAEDEYKQHGPKN